MNNTIYWQYDPEEDCIMVSLCSGHLCDDADDMDIIDNVLTSIPTLYFDGLSENYYDVYLSEADYWKDNHADEDTIRRELSKLGNFIEAKFI